MENQIPKGKNDLSRSAYLFRFADLIYDMRADNMSALAIQAEVNARLTRRKVSRPTITEFLKRVDDPEFRAFAKAYCQAHNMSYVEWHEIAVLANNKPAPVLHEARNETRTAATEKLASKAMNDKTTDPVKQKPEKQEPIKTKNRETVNIIGFSSPIDVVMLGDKVAYKPSPELTYSRVNPIDEYEEVPGGTTRSELKAVFVKSDSLNREKRKLFREYKDDRRILIPPPEVIFERLKNAAMADPKFAATARDHLTSDMTEYFYIEEAAQYETRLR